MVWMRSSLMSRLRTDRTAQQGHDRGLTVDVPHLVSRFRRRLALPGWEEAGHDPRARQRTTNSPDLPVSHGGWSFGAPATHRIACVVPRLSRTRHGRPLYLNAV